MTTTFATIGSGRRTRFLLRLARAMPGRLRVGGRPDGLQVSEKAFSHTMEAEIADLAQRTSDLGLRLELAGPSGKPGRGGNTVASLRHLSQALCRCRAAGGSTLVEGEV